MANYVTIKKKLNVPVLVILLIFAIVPGIIYFIWSKIPTRICTDPEKGHGWLGRVIGAGIALVNWLGFCIGTEFAFTFIIPLIPSVILFVVAFLSKKGGKQLMLWLNILVAVVVFGISCWLFIYGMVSLVGCITVIVATVKGFNHYNYHKLGKGKDEDEEDEDEDEE